MKILIRATNWVGDAIMALPALREIRRRFPNAYISLLALPYVADLYRDESVANTFISYERMGAHAGINGRERLAAQLRAEKFDVALLLQNAFDAAWVAWRAGIPKRIGYGRDARGWLLTDAIKIPRPDQIPAHEKFYYLELLRRSGWIDTLPDVQSILLCVPEEKKHRASGILAAAGSRVDKIRIAVGAGASYGSAKCWAPERFAATLNSLQAQFDAEVILFGTSIEASVSAAIAAALRQAPIDLTGKTSLADLPALLSQCHLFVGNDSGAMHVAAAVGLPVVAVFGPTDPHGTSPVTPRCTIVQEKTYCSPCFLRRCPTDHRCMTSISPEAVEAAAKPWLAALEVRPA